MTGIQLIIPHAPSAYQIRIDWYYEIWKQEKEAKEPKFVVENVRFHHDPHWAHRVMSIQAAHDGNHVVWQLARPIMISDILATAPAITVPGLGILGALTITTLALELAEKYRKLHG